MFNQNLPLFVKNNPLTDTDTLYHEATARSAGYGLIAGVDEAGRGPLAGPVVAAAVIVPENVKWAGIKDSKQMTHKARDEAFSTINEGAVAVSVGVVSHRYIDEFNILKAALEAMKRAVSSLTPAPEYLLVDGNQAIPISVPQKCLKKGDQISMSISAASIIAKVYRDRIMLSHHEQFPMYGFFENKGYGTAKHRSAIRRHGPTRIHRRTFRGVLR